MKRFVLAWAIFVALTACAYAQEAMTVAVCGTVPQQFPVGSVRVITQDINGNLCTNTASSSGGASIAPTGGAPPGSANYMGYNVSGVFTGATGSANGLYVDGSLSTFNSAVTAAPGSYAAGSLLDVAYTGMWDSLTPPTGTINTNNGIASLYAAVLNPAKIVGNTGAAVDSSPGSFSANVINTQQGQLSHVHSTSLEASHVIKGSAGSLYGFYCTAITGGTTGYCIANNTTTAPSNSAATTPLDMCYFTTTAGCSFSRHPSSIASSVGITILISSNATPFTFTNTTLTGYIAADYQ